MCVLLVALAAVIQGLPGTVWAQEKPEVELYGFIRVDAMRSDSEMNNNLVPMWVLNEQDTTNVVKDDGSFALHPRLTRLGIRFNGYQLSNEWTLDMGVETDFQVFSAGSESRQLVRMRLGYVRLNHNAWHIMAGQHWDIISTLYPNVNLNGVNWNNGNTGDRRPQVRVTYAPEIGNGTISLTAAAAQFGAVGNSDVDKNGRADTRETSVPMFQGWFGVDQKIGENTTIKAGIWGHYWQENDFIIEAGGPSTRRTADLESWSVGADAKVKATKWLLFQGEAWTGENLGDIRGGIGQFINLDTGKGIGASGGWFEADVVANDRITLIAGYTIDDVRDRDISEGSRAKNRAPYGAVRWRPWKKLMLTGEYVRFETTYLGYDKASVNNLVNIHLMYFL